MVDPYDVIAVLTADHRLIDELLERLDAEDRPAEMQRLFLRIAGELAAHEAAEHDVVFPVALAAIPVGDHQIRDAITGHDEVNLLLAEMLRLDPAGFGFLKRAGALIVGLQSHFSAEEELLFPRLRAVLSLGQRNELATRVRMAKRAAPVFPTARRRPMAASA